MDLVSLVFSMSVLCNYTCAFISHVVLKMAWRYFVTRIKAPPPPPNIIFFNKAVEQILHNYTIIYNIASFVISLYIYMCL